jgi:hypothetical protein
MLQSRTKLSESSSLIVETSVIVVATWQQVPSIYG